MPTVIVIALAAVLMLSGCGGGGSSLLAPETTASGTDQNQEGADAGGIVDEDGRVISTPPVTQTPTVTTTAPATQTPSAITKPPSKFQDGTLIKGKWQQRSSIAQPRFNLAAWFESLFISTAYAGTTTLGLDNSLIDIAPLKDGQFQMLMFTASTSFYSAVSLLVTDKNDSSTWKKISVMTPGEHNGFHSHRLLADGNNPGHSFIVSISRADDGGGGKGVLNLTEVTPDANGIPDTLKSLKSFDGYMSMTGIYSHLYGVALRNIDNSGGALVAAAISIDSAYNHVYQNSSSDPKYTCEPSVIAVYNAAVADWQKILIPCEDEIKDDDHSAGYLSLDFDAHNNLIVFRTSIMSGSSYILSGHKIPYNAATQTFGQPVTIVKKTITDSPVGFAQFKANPIDSGSDKSEGYVMAYMTNTYLSGKNVNIPVDADCSDPDALKEFEYFYFLNKCFKYKAIQEKHNQVVVYQLDTSTADVLKEVDLIPLPGKWMEDWWTHNFTTATDISNGFQFIIAISQGTLYPPVIARYSADADTVKKEYFDSAGLALGNPMHLAVQDQSLMIGTWLMAPDQSICDASGYCTSRSQALGTVLFEFVKDESAPQPPPPPQDPYGQ